MPTRSPEDPPGRVAVVGAAGSTGVWLRAALEDHGVAGANVDLFGDVSGDAVLSEYAGEARLVQPLTPDALEGHGTIFLCESHGASRLPDRALAVFLDARDESVVLAHEPLLPHAERTGRVRVPDALAVVLSELLAPLRGLGIESVQAVILRPAASRGPDGLDELREQTVRLLRFEPTPTEVFGKPLAFNLIPDPAAGGAHGDPARSSRDIRRLLGPAAPAVTLRTATGPWFHGHLLFVHLLGSPLDGGELRRALQAAQGVELLDSSRGSITPAESPEERITVVFEADSGPDGTWIRALAAEAESAAARQAVSVAAAAGRL